MLAKGPKRTLPKPQNKNKRLLFYMPLGSTNPCPGRHLSAFLLLGQRLSVSSPCTAAAQARGGYQGLGTVVSGLGAKGARV